MEMMGNESVIWEGHPTWRAMLSFHIKWFIATLVLFGLLLLVRWAGSISTTALIGGDPDRRDRADDRDRLDQRFFTQYTITTKRLNIRRGILSKTESSTNVDRIQNITVKQSPVDRIMKVGSIDFDTAGDESSDRFSFLGVNNPQDLRERIMHARDDEKAAHAARSAGRAWPDGRVGRALLISLLAAAVARDDRRRQAGSTAATRERVTFIGDSIASAIAYDRALEEAPRRPGSTSTSSSPSAGGSSATAAPTRASRPLTLVDLLPTIQARADGRRRGRLQRLRGHVRRLGRDVAAGAAQGRRQARPLADAARRPHVVPEHERRRSARLRRAIPS